MAMFTDIQFDQASGRHELHFVNQQYDFLMCICWSESKKDYAFNVSDAEALEIAGSSWGGKFSVSELLQRARKELPEMDRKPPKT
jgi:hypothetical protein